MGKQLPLDITFDQWVSRVFDHPESEEPWYYKYNHDFWNAEKKPEIAVEYMTRLFSNAGALLSRYSNAQVNAGLWYIVHVANSDHSIALRNLDNRVSMDKCIACIASMLTLYKDVFEIRCSPYLSHLEQTHNPLNSACYMWWDLLGPHMAVDHPNGRAWNIACLRVMSGALKLSSIACQESALHGLGHWKRYFPKEVERVVTDFLKRNPNMDADLRKYTLRAKRGDVL